MLHKKLFTTLLFSTLLAASQTSTTASPPTAPTPDLAASQAITIPTSQQGETKLSPLTLANWAVKLVVHALVAIVIGELLAAGYFIEEKKDSIIACLLVLCTFYAYEGVNKLFSAKRAPESEAAEKQDSNSLHAIIQLGLRPVVHLVCHLALFLLAWYVAHQEKVGKDGKTHFGVFKEEGGFQTLALGFCFLLVLYRVDIVCKAVDRWIGEGEDGKSSSWMQFFREVANKFIGHVLVAIVAGAIWYGVEKLTERRAEEGMILGIAVLILLPTYLYYVLGWVVDKLFALGKKGAAPSTYTAEPEGRAPTAA